MKFPNIEAERARNQLSRKDLCYALGVTTKTYYNWQHGVTDISAPKLRIMADLFRVSVDYLLGRE